MLAFLSGKKTYIVGAVMVLVGGLHYAGYMNDETFKIVEGILTGAGFITARAAIAKS